MSTQFGNPKPPVETPEAIALDAWWRSHYADLVKALVELRCALRSKGIDPDQFEPECEES